jgi:LPS-assembly protein
VLHLFIALLVVPESRSALAQTEEPPPAPAQNASRKTERIDIDRFGSLFLDAQNNLQATDILARWREYTIQAQGVEGNLDRGEYLFKGSVLLEGGGVDARGEMLRLNVRRRRWQLEGAGADLLPEFLKYQLQGAVRLSGQKLEGEQEEAHLHQGEMTTCLLEHPHYHFSAGRVDVVVDKRLVARDVSLSALGRRLFTIPTLVVPLDRRLSRGTLPQVGQSVEEGYYIKTALGYLLGDNAGTARIDLMQKKGVGLGFDQQYLLGGAAGLLSLYYLNDRSRGTRSVTAQLRHEQKLLGFDARLTGDLRSGSYLYYSDTRASSWQLSLSRAWSGGNLSLLSRLSQQSSAGYFSDSTVNSLRWNQRWGTRASLTLSTDLSRFRSLSGGEVRSQQEQLATQAMLSGDAGKFDWNLSFNRVVPVGGQTGGFYFGGLEKTPELVLSTTDRRLFGRDLGLQMQLGLGSFRELPQGQPIQRLLFETRWSPSLPVGDSTSLTYSGLFRQVFTSDGTAQYILQGNASWQVRYGQNSRWYMDYRYLRPYGFTPLRTEYTGTTNFASAGLEWNAGRAFSLRAYAGYDLFARQRGSRPWQPLNLGIQWQPNPVWTLNVQSTLNLNEGQWNYLRAYLRARSQAFSMNLNSVYDPIRHQWANASLWLDTQVFRTPLRVQTYLTYNGYVKRFEGRQLLLTWDLHCWELSVGYIDNPLGFRADREVVFRLRIKAFPEAQRFGVGQFGQLLETGGGWTY